MLGIPDCGHDAFDASVHIKEFMSLSRISSKILRTSFGSRSITTSIMSAKPIPILVTGRTEVIGRMVRDHMLPEYEGECSFKMLFIPESPRYEHD